MDKKKLSTIAYGMFIVIFICFIAFFTYILAFEKNDVLNVRNANGSVEIENYKEVIENDKNTPIGKKKIITWTIDDHDIHGSCLIYYMSHYSSKVYIDDELVYSISPDKDNKIASSTSSYWAVVPLYEKDNGKIAKIELIPLFKNVMNEQPTLYVGSKSSVLTLKMKLNFYELIAASICIVAGLIMLCIGIYLFFRRRNINENNFLLAGIFSLILGLSRITDLYASPIIFDIHPMVLGYITLGFLSIAAIPFLLFIRRSYHQSLQPCFEYLAIGISIAAFVSLLLQIFNILELKQTLIITHICIILAMISVSIITFINIFKYKNDREKGYIFTIAAVIVGLTIDLTLYYIQGSSSGMIYTLYAFLICIFVSLIQSIRRLNIKAYTDMHTGLLNRLRFEDLMQSNAFNTQDYGIYMFDLNSLKETNDTLGHSHGDQLIFRFANILRNTLPKDAIIARWGGDEFVAVIQDTTNEELLYYKNKIKEAVIEHNMTSSMHHIHYAAGFALSNDHKELNTSQLLQWADTMMYKDKIEWKQKRIIEKSLNK